MMQKFLAERESYNPIRTLALRHHVVVMQSPRDHKYFTTPGNGR